MNSSTASIRTPWNKGRDIKGRPDRRVLVSGRWVRRDPMADNVLAGLKMGQERARV